MKNRDEQPSSYKPMKFDDLYNMKLSNDYSECVKAVTTIGYILEVEDGSSESCNCHSKTNKDTHIYVVRDETVTDKGEAIIVEVTPRFRAHFGNTESIKKEYKGHTVEISGFLFQDQEHKQNSTVDNGKGNHWRHTIWEIHPITELKLIK